MRLLNLAVLAAAIAAPAVAAPAIDAPAGRYVVDPAHTSVTWKVSHLGLSFYTARFAKIESTVVLDPAAPAKSTLDVTIDANSVRTDFPDPAKVDFDKEIGGDARFLYGSKFPQIRFVARGIAVTGARTAKITGDLTLRGVTKPVTLDATLNGTLPANPRMGPARIGVSAHGSIKRTDFGMDFGTQFVGDTVELIVEAEYHLAQ